MIFLNYNSYKIWSINNKFFMFDILNLINVEIDENLFNIFTSKQWDRADKDTINYLQKLCDKELFFYDIEDIQFLDNIEEKEMSFSLTPTLECNLDCKYCFADAGRKYTGKNRKYDQNMLENIARYLVEKHPNIRKYRLSFVSGGEPFLDKKGLLDMIRFFHSFFKKEGMSFTMWLCTNGTLIDEEDIKALDKYNMQIGISQDGTKIEHDKCRVDKHGQGTYDIVARHINSILKSHELSERIRKIWGSAVITSTNKSVLSILLEHKKLGLANSQMRFIQTSKEDSLAFKEKDLPTVHSWIDELIDFLEKEILEDRLMYPLMMLNENDYIGKIIRRLIIQKPYVKRCHAGNLHLAFTPEGDIYPCDSFVGNTEFKLGNVLIGDSNTFPNYSVLERHDCKDCWIRFVCGGDCYYNAYSCNYDIQMPDNIFCKIMHYVVKKSLLMLNNIQKENPKIYLELRRILTLKDSVNYKVK